MPKSIEEWVAELTMPELPVLHRTSMEMARFGRRPDEVAASKLATVVLHDPMMTLNILRLANATRHGRLGNEVTTIEHAAMMIGISPLFKALSSLPTLEDVLSDQGEALANLLRVFNRSVHAAYQGREWAIRYQDIKVEEVYIAALLRDLPEMMLWCFAPETAGQIRGQERRERISYAAAFKKTMGFDIRDFRRALGRGLHYPEQLLELVDCTEAGRVRVQGVLLAASIARLSENGWYGEELRADVEAMADLLHAPQDEVEWGVRQAAVAAARQWQWYGTPPAAAWLPMLPGEWPEEPAPVCGERVCLAPHPDRLHRTLDEISAHLDGTLDFEQMMLLVLRGMREGLGLSRALFALATPDGSRVRVKYVLGAEPGSMLRHFEFGLHTPHLFARLMEKMQGVWFNEANAKTLGPLIPSEMRKVIGEGDFFAMSIAVGGKPAGLFYADRKHGACALDEHSYQEFKKLCLRGAQGLAHLAKK